MLRDLPLLHASRDDHDPDIFMNGIHGLVTDNENRTENETPYEDPFDDVFGSAPSSPSLAAQETEDDHEHEYELGYENAPMPRTTAEHSDIPRLRSTHITNGYRDGIAKGKEQEMQVGFDEGYQLGAELGLLAGFYLGVLEGFVKADGGREARALLVRARRELDLKVLCGREWVGEDGVWMWDVEGAEEEDGREVGFERVAAAHPVLGRWKGELGRLVREFGCEVERAR
ncbi:hypothetical protein LTR62_004635 [Meristemomyces frigidus]|uniref:Protein YAE1 n=1 Tax=Meristemomyces frigidus TaxID=1508187 RepID=A0AAN7TQK2_9PEZI|nr:hypothetical protein LTR62_004635 [Meristemomyces frigidus]